MTRHGVHFMSGLPRSGSTLLSAILKQNPAIRHAGISTPVAPMMVKITSVMVEGEFQTEFDSAATSRILRGTLYNYYGSDGTDGVIVDNNRMWCTRLGLINSLFPDARVICCVRDPVWIVDSFERLFQQDPLLSSKIVPIQSRGSLHDRVEHLLSKDGTFGYCWRALNEAYFSTFAQKLLLVDYDRLVTDPSGTLKRITGVLGLPNHDYDFNKVDTNEPIAFDQQLGTPGLHTVRSQVRPNHRRPVLPPEIVSRLAGGTFWRKQDMNPGHVTIIA